MIVTGISHAKYYFEGITIIVINFAICPSEWFGRF